MLNKLKRYNPVIVILDDAPYVEMRRTEAKESYVKFNDLSKIGCCVCDLVNDCASQYNSVMCKFTLESKKSKMPINCPSCKLCGICRIEVPYGSEICKKALGVE